jgi:outer membrane lipoprotein-sorting protein
MGYNDRIMHRPADGRRREDLMPKAAVRLVAAALIASLPSWAGQGPAPASSKDALTVLARTVEAMGGRKVLASIKDTTLKGTAELIQMGRSLPITIYQKEPDKLRIDLDLSEVAPGQVFTQAFDGTKGWGTNMQTWADEEMSEALSRDLSHQALGNDSLLDPRKLGITYVLKPKAVVDGKDYLVLEQTLADGHKSSIFIDPETYLPYKSATTSVDPITGGSVETESILGDYRKVDGLMINHSLRTFQGGAEIMRLTIAAVTLNSGLDDALFVLK